LVGPTVLFCEAKQNKNVGPFFCPWGRKMGQFLDEYRTFCASPQAELALEILEAFPCLAA